MYSSARILLLALTTLILFNQNNLLSNAQAQEIPQRPAHPKLKLKPYRTLKKQIIPFCKDVGPSLRTAPIGFRCKTKSNYTSSVYIYKRVDAGAAFGEAWQFSLGNKKLIWSDILPGVFTQEQAEGACEALDNEGSIRLPTAEEFAGGANRRFFEALPHLAMSDVYWTGDTYQSPSYLYGVAYHASYNQWPAGTPLNPQVVAQGGKQYVGPGSKLSARCVREVLP